MSFEDNYQVTSKFSEHTHDFLSSHTIAPTPVNYAVIYLYISNENELLTAAIDRQLQSGDIISTDFLADLFSRYVSFSQQVEETVLAPFEESLTKTLNNISEQVSKEDKAANSLKKLDKILNKTEHHASLENIVNYLFSTINNAKNQHQALSKELTSTQQEINQLKEKLASSREEALVDSLTGLLNRRGCDEKLQELSLQDTHSSLAIDIDHFKSINDKFGHFIGDKVIQRIAKTIKDHTSEQDIAVRFGGEEFVVVMTNKNIAQAKEVAETIREAISKLKLIQRETNTYLPPISVSIGVAQSGNAQSWVNLFEQADEALYQAKNSGRNRCICA
ncbi:MAG: GGDEF domain-containing protein [Colwellia sp.]|nr:GGDEF domain-containing protein [Colwellia sp.]MCW9081020.1 GGDEF domain-containing protein [Colwellia sp.]